MNKRTLYGTAGTVLWLLVAAALAWSQREAWPCMSLNEWGDFFAGVVAPLAFLWLIIGYLQQGDEVRSNTETLQRQQAALERQVDETAALERRAAEQVKVATERLELARQEAERLRAIDKARTQPVFGFVSGSGTGVTWEMEFRNSGGPAYDLQISIDPPSGSVRITPDFVDRGGVGKIIVSDVTTFPRTLIVSYVDQYGESGTLRLVLPGPGTFHQGPLYK